MSRVSNVNIAGLWNLNNQFHSSFPVSLSIIIFPSQIVGMTPNLQMKCSKTLVARATCFGWFRHPLVLTAAPTLHNLGPDNQIPVWSPSELFPAINFRQRHNTRRLHLHGTFPSRTCSIVRLFGQHPLPIHTANHLLDPNDLHRYDHGSM